MVVYIYYFHGMFLQWCACDRLSTEACGL